MITRKEAEAYEKLARAERRLADARRQLLPELQELLRPKQGAETERAGDSEKSSNQQPPKKR